MSPQEYQSLMENEFYKALSGACSSQGISVEMNRLSFDTWVFVLSKGSNTDTYLLRNTGDMADFQLVGVTH